jgi:hypothetical protein
LAFLADRREPQTKVATAGTAQQDGNDGGKFGAALTDRRPRQPDLAGNGPVGEPLSGQRPNPPIHVIHAAQPTTSADAAQLTTRGQALWRYRQHVANELDEYDRADALAADWQRQRDEYDARQRARR